MPYIGHIIPTNQKQDAWEQKNLLPSMFGDIVESIKHSIIETQQLNKEIERKKADIEEMKKHGKFVDGVYIPNTETKPSKVSKDKSKVVEDINQMIKDVETLESHHKKDKYDVNKDIDKMISDIDEISKKRKRKIITTKMSDDLNKMLTTSHKPKSPSKKTQLLGDALTLMMDTQLTKPAKKGRKKIDETIKTIAAINDTIKKRKTKSPKAKMTDEIIDLLDTTSQSIKQPSQKTKLLGDALTLMTESHLGKTSKKQDKQPIDIEDKIEELEKTIKKSKHKKSDKTISPECYFTLLQAAEEAKAIKNEISKS